MQSFNEEFTFWRKLWVSGPVMLPSYLMVAVISSNFQGWWWLIVAAVGLWVVGKIYIKVVLEKKISKQWKMSSIAALLFLFQISLIIFVYLAAIK
ncbi:hypothetical protein [Vreelandella olivaria]|uniref:hypothetical protein n=1 Tax=Vreelandella olivaria TaxID=390919 RepID=UPI00201F5412|nr:hypothetical protein [Halomonas olivaria]